MQLSLAKLQKFFKLEAERGFDNRAVVGGLDKIAGSWEAQARVDNLPDSSIQNVINTLKQYPLLEPDARAKSLKDVWQMLQITREENPQALVVPVRKENVNQSQAARRTAEIGDHSTTELPGFNGSGNKPPSPKPQKFHPDNSSNRPRQPRQQLQSFDNPSPVGHSSNDALVGLNAPLTVINGVGPRHAQTLENLNLQTLGDMLYFFPRRYDDYSQLKTINRLVYGEDITVLASIQSITNRQIHGGQTQLTEAVASDGTGSLRLTWFNQPWQANRLRSGLPVTISGKVEQYLGRPVMNNPECEPIDQEQLHTNRIVPVYPLTAHITQHWLRRIMHQTVSYWAPRIPEYLPVSIRKEANLVDLSTALLQCHFPASLESLKSAQDRLAFDEIFFLQLGVMQQKRAWKTNTAQVFEVADDWLKSQLEALPFTLTQAQQHALSDIRKDLASGRPMNRLLQGDVGSGKTIIAGLGIAIVTQTGAQAALMAPTSILAQQHFRSLQRLLCHQDGQSDDSLKLEQVRLLIGDTPEIEKDEIKAGLADGSIKLIIGTHALIEDPIVFNRLQFIVVDEQHRFGVEQRGLLRQKGENPHLLVITATPIPRSLALTIYGDLDLTVMDELPPGRQIIETHVVHPRERERAYSLIRSQVENHHQAFIIYPLVEQGENEETRAAVDEYTRLQKEIFPRLKLGLLHGRLKPEEKDEAMRRFQAGDFQILVSTSVVEVGVDIPNATVMLVEGANRFGLAQLHQFRGRVGRSEAKSYCLLIPETGDGLENQRLSAMAETNNGFVLAERDLEQRGPGEFLGTRQSGYSELKMANLSNIHLIEKARVQAQALFEVDPGLQLPENLPLRQTFQRFWNEHHGDVS